MSGPLIGEIRMFAGNFAPAGWAFCEGQLLPISENDALFTLIGSMYGGDGVSTFGLPDLRGRAPVHQGPGPGLTARTISETGGQSEVTLTPAQVPHSHQFMATQNPGSSPNPANAGLAQPAFRIFVSDAPLTQLATNAVAPVGGSQPHENRQPFLPIRFIIALFGVFPQRN